MNVLQCGLSTITYMPITQSSMILLCLIELVIPITVNDVHHMCNNTYIDTSWNNCYRESAPLTYHTISQFITCMKC